ncbi:two-component system sensor histidine kinase RppB [Leptolyngbya sp. FACHB-711]|uniref:two-component system sensor histidine kinase RppB n=1 Tax=unclassified Leptolyngbya TaxID=2650499 RepID=UPI001683420F|nr:two-component system sensor histidine kinase RppB [Leptolyngbya sp. FACHB-711]MBD1852748.1 two-component sensor histidine kinase [Cyanobacteria bacterium FACHB-502]MBD2026414.1 two-component sensor histidine kinase [Leptolyngbya sp. FACHB-711]
MKHSQIFHTTRLRLAGLYAGTMGVILTICAVGFYEAMAHSHFSELNHRIETVAGTLHDGLEASLQEPSKLEPVVQKFVPTLCIAGTDCSSNSTALHYLGVFQENGYYIRFLSLSGQLLASGGQVPTDLPAQIETELWQTLEAPDGTRYRQLSLLLKTANQDSWGYMQVGRSLSELDGHMVWVRLSLLIGLPSAMLLVVVASWWLAGQAMQPVYRSYRQMQQFTADAAHELRTPLAAIQANLESTLTTDASDADAWDTLRTVERQNSRLSRLVHDLLLLSRMDLQGLPTKQNACNLNDLVNDLVEEFSALALASNISLTADIQTNTSITVFGSEEQLYRSVANLITNAIQYIPSGGKVTVHLKQEDHHALIQVQDTGIGIPHKEQARIFDRFYRVNSDRSRHTGGAGLGLAIAQAIVQAHQGTIQVQSELSKGSVFSIRLPLRSNFKMA